MTSDERTDDDLQRARRRLRQVEAELLRREGDAVLREERTRARFDVVERLLALGHAAEADQETATAIAESEALCRDLPGEDRALLLRADAWLLRATTLAEVAAAARDAARERPDEIPDGVPPDPEDAQRLFRAVVDSLDPIRDHGPAPAARLTAAHRQLAVHLEDTGRTDDAFPHLNVALQYAELADREAPGITSNRAALALVHNALGHHYSHTDRLTDARRHHERSLALNEALIRGAETHGEDARYWRECLATDHENLCDLHARSGDRQQALEHSLRCAEIRDALCASPHAPTDLRIQLADAWRDVAELSLDLGRVDDALHRYAVMLDVLRDVAKRRPNDEDAQFRLADGLLVHGYALEDQGRLADALEVFRRALEVDRHLIELSPDEPRWHANTAHCHLCLALILLDSDDEADADEAAEHIEEGLRLLHDQLRRNPNEHGLLRDLAHFHDELAAAHSRVDAIREAIEHHVAAESANVRLIELDGRDQEALADLALTYDSLAELHERLRDLIEATRYGELAIRTEERLCALDPESVEYQTRLVQALLHLARTHSELQRPIEALQALERARTLAARLARLVPRDDHVAGLGAQIERGIGESLREDGRLDEAETVLARSVHRFAALVARTERPQDWFIAQAESLEALAELRLESGRAEQALDDLRLAVQRRREVLAFGPDDPAAARELAQTLETEAEARERLGDMDRAVELRAEAARLFERFGEE